MITTRFATEFARAWIAAWNSHDLDRVLAHYADDFEMLSPYISRIAGVTTGKLKGKPAIGAYWARALQLMPDLQFELLSAFSGIDSIVIHYRGVRGPAAEVLFFDDSGKVVGACAHYAPDLCA